MTSEDIARLYGDLRRMAAGLINREQAGHTLQATALVHEAFVRLVKEAEPKAGQGPAGTLGVAAKVMRQVLVDHARRRNTEKRGNGVRPLSLNGAPSPDVPAPDPVPLVDILDLHDALERFETIDPRGAELVNLRFFAGLSVEEAAAALQISRSTAEEEWRIARAWLAHALKNKAAR